MTSWDSKTYLFENQTSDLARPMPDFLFRHGRACPGHPRGATCDGVSAWVYILTNKPNGILYVGVTSDLVQRIWQHREELVEGFTKRHGLKRLVYVETHDDIRAAIQREKNLKHWSRAWKVRLILNANPAWADLYPTIIA